DRGDRAPTPRRVPGDLQGLVGRGEDGGVHGGEGEASVPRPAHGEGLGDRDGVPRRGRDRAPGGGDPGVPAPAALGGGERPRGAHRDVRKPAGSTSHGPTRTRTDRGVQENAISSRVTVLSPVKSCGGGCARIVSAVSSQLFHGTGPRPNSRMFGSCSISCHVVVRFPSQLTAGVPIMLL